MAYFHDAPAFPVTYNLIVALNPEKRAEGSPIMDQFVTGNHMRDIYANRFPDLKLYLLRSYDPATNITDTEDVTLDREEAYRMLKDARFNSNWESGSTFDIIKATPRELETDIVDGVEGHILPTERLNDIYKIARKLKPIRPPPFQDFTASGNA
jgi:hypothetical protein